MIILEQIYNRNYDNFKTTLLVEHCANGLHMVQSLSLPSSNLMILCNLEWFTYLVPAYEVFMEKRLLNALFSGTCSSCLMCCDRSVSPYDFPHLETLVRKIVNDKQPFERLEMKKEDLLKMFEVCGHCVFFDFVASHAVTIGHLHLNCVSVSFHQLFHVWYQ